VTPEGKINIQKSIFFNLESKERYN